MKTTKDSGRCSQVISSCKCPITVEEKLSSLKISMHLTSLHSLVIQLKVKQRNFKEVDRFKVVFVVSKA